MRRVFAVLIALLVICGSVFAGESDAFKVWDSISFSLEAEDGPLYKETLADPYGFTTKYGFDYALNDVRIINIRTSVFGEKSGSDDTSYYVDLPFEEAQDDNGLYNRVRLGSSVSFFRLDFDGRGKMPSIKAEVGFGGAMNTLFSGSDCLGFDGTYFIGTNIKVGSMVTLRAGIHHFSGHYGDETLDDFYDELDVDFSGKKWKINNIEALQEALGNSYVYGTTYYIGRAIEYVRDNSWLVGVQVNPINGLLVYGELESPKSKTWLRPFADTVYGYKTASNDELVSKVGSKEKVVESVISEEVRIKQLGFYKALRAHFGAEYGYSFKNIGTAYASIDFQLHQDGQTEHMPNQYDPSKPWEYELTFDVGFELGKPILGRNITVFAEYHDGRAQTLDFYYLRMKTVSVGFCVR